MEMIVTNPEGERVVVEYGSVRIVTDQPTESGPGVHPTPFALFMASIGACGAYYAFAFCRARGIPTAGIRAVADARTDGDMISSVEIRLELPADFPEKYMDAIVRAAMACKVVKHLERPPKVGVVASKRPA